MSSNGSRFGQIVRARRLALNDLTQLDVWKNRGGPANSTLTAIEGGQWKRNAATFRKLDTALEWEPGSARRVFDEGADPVPIAAPRPQPAATAGYLTDDELLAELTYRVKRYAALDAKGSESGDDAAKPTTAKGRGQTGHIEPPRAASRPPIDDQTETDRPG